jgi:hypothetical protein
MDPVNEAVSQVDERDKIRSPQAWKGHHNGVNRACIVNADVRGPLPDNDGLWRRTSIYETKFPAP